MSTVATGMFEPNERVEAIIVQINKLTVRELVALKEALQGQWGVHIPRPMLVPVEGEQDAPAEPQTAFHVTLGAAQNRLETIKAIRELGIAAGLKEAKELVDSIPVVIGDLVPRERADEIRARLEAAGAVIDIS